MDSRLSCALRRLQRRSISNLEGVSSQIGTPSAGGCETGGEGWMSAVRIATPPIPCVYRSDNLALIYEEILTAVVRVRANRDGVGDASGFRRRAREVLRAAANQAMVAGYPAENVQDATFATVAFLDESVLNSQNPIFADWLRQPLQQELFGAHSAGDVFFRKLLQLLERGDSAELADLLEVYYLCLVLGFSGRYGSGIREDPEQIMKSTAEKIDRIRSGCGQFLRASMLPTETVLARQDPWVGKLRWAAALLSAATGLLFITYAVALRFGARL